MSISHINHYIIVALRNLKKHKISSILSLSGLAAAFSLSLITAIMVWDAKTSDGWVEASDNIYMLQRHSTRPSGEESFSMATNGKLAPLLQSKLDGVLTISRLNKWRASTKGNGAFPYQLDDFQRVDEGFAEIFPFETLYGDYAKTLSEPRGLVLSSEMSESLYGDENPVGLNIDLTIDDKIVAYKIGAVLAPLPPNTHFEISALAMLVESDYEDDYCGLFTWNCTGREATYLRLDDQADIAKIEEQIEAIRTTVMPVSPSGSKTAFELIPVVGILWHDKLRWGFMASLADQQALSGVALAALVLLISAIINHTNIATSIAITRGREVAVRKVLGASKRQLRVQYLGESILIASLAYGLSLVIAWYASPLVTGMSRSNLDLFSGYYDQHLFVGLIAAVTIGVLAGIYPAFVQGRGDIAAQLQSNQSSVAGSGRFIQKALVMLQVACGIGLVLATIVIYNQITYLQTMDKGFQFKGVMHVLVRPFKDNDQRVTFKQEVGKISSVTDVALSTSIPFIDSEWRNSFRNKKLGQDYELNYLGVDDNFFGFYNVKPIAGRLLSNDIALDREHINTDEDRNTTGNVLVNKAALSVMGYDSPEAAVGQVFGYDVTFDENRYVSNYTIVGVLPDIRFKGGKKLTRPYFHSLDNQRFGYLSIRVDADNLSDVLEDIKGVWGQFIDDRPFEYTFANDNLAKAYRQERATADLLLLIAGASVLLSVAGLYGLARHTVQQRKKEIVLRRVLGAENSHILKLLVKQLSSPVIGGLLVGLTLSGLWVRDWLTEFEFPMEPDGSLYGVLIVMVIFVAGITTIGHALRALRLRPADVLRDE